MGLKPPVGQQSGLTDGFVTMEKCLMGSDVFFVQGKMDNLSTAKMLTACLAQKTTVKPLSYKMWPAVSSDP
ncbi:hypothetical protein PAMP_005284 [Pampus punctatissimus]